MTNALILLGHPDPKSFNGRLAQSYAAGFTAAGGSAEIVSLTELTFDPVLRHGYAKAQELEPDLAKLRATIESAAQVTWVFPTYWASTPAIVKAVVDRLFVPGWAFRYGKKALPDGLLAGRASRVITTMDSPAIWYALAHNRAIHGAFARGTLSFVGFSPVKVHAIYGTRRLSEAKRNEEAQRVFAQAEADAARAQRRAPLALPAGAPTVSPSGTS